MTYLIGVPACSGSDVSESIAATENTIVDLQGCSMHFLVKFGIAVGWIMINDEGQRVAVLACVEIGEWDEGRGFGYT